MSRPSSPTVVILAAGIGKRMQSPQPKVLQPLCGRPMLAWVCDQALALEPERIVVVAGHGAELVEQALAEHGFAERVEVCVQEPQHGTGHALQVAARHVIERGGETPATVVVLYGDMPCLAPESLTMLCSARDALGAEASALLTAWVDDPHGLGRVLREEDEEGDDQGDDQGGDQGAVRGIVEERDASDEERAIHEVNLGVYAFPGAKLFELLPKLSNDNAQREYYLTDVIGMLVAEERPVVAVELEDLEQSVGVNTLSQLAEARWVLQLRILEQHLANGVFIEDPASTWIDHGVTIGRGTRILPATVIRAGVAIGEDCEVGPFTHLRVGTVLEDEAEVGNFTECKQSTVGRGSKAKHLSYLGDTVVGAKVNIGAGTIFANYDGKAKHKSVVEDGAFVGSGTVVVAPNRIGKGATTGAGAVVTRGSDIKAGEVWVGVPARRLEKR